MTRIGLLLIAALPVLDRLGLTVIYNQKVRETFDINGWRRLEEVGEPYVTLAKKPAPKA
jgi:hypothetical protein